MADDERRRRSEVDGDERPAPTRRGRAHGDGGARKRDDRIQRADPAPTRTSSSPTSPSVRTTSNSARAAAADSVVPVSFGSSPITTSIAAGGPGDHGFERTRGPAHAAGGRAREQHSRHERDRDYEGRGVGTCDTGRADSPPATAPTTSSGRCGCAATAESGVDDRRPPPRSRSRRRPGDSRVAEDSRRRQAPSPPIPGRHTRFGRFAARSRRSRRPTASADPPRGSLARRSARSSRRAGARQPIDCHGASLSGDRSGGRLVRRDA